MTISIEGTIGFILHRPGRESTKRIGGKEFREVARRGPGCQPAFGKKCEAERDKKLGKTPWMVSVSNPPPNR
jgi:hypothetical protein